MNFNHGDGSLVLFTDLEGDDAVAIKLLSVKYKNSPVLVIVGESREHKTQLARDIFSHYGFTNVTILQGLFTKKMFPSASLTAFSSIKWNIDTMFYNPEKINEFLEQHPEAVILALKPIVELLSVDLDRLANTTLCFSGSYNLRSMVKDHPNIIDFVNTSFARVIHFENFMVTGVNSLSEPTVVDIIFKDERLSQLIKSWNALTWDDCLDTTAELAVVIKNELNTDKPDWAKLEGLYDRITTQNLHIAGNMIAAKAKQVCFADIAFVTLLFYASSKTIENLETHQANLSLGPNNYTTMDKNASSKVTFLGKLGDLSSLYADIAQSLEKC